MVQILVFDNLLELQMLTFVLLLPNKKGYLGSLFVTLFMNIVYLVKNYLT